MPKPTPKPSGHIKKLLRLAARDDVDVWCEDECHFQQHGSRCTMWVPPEDFDPILQHAPTRKSVAVFGAVRVSDGLLVAQQEKVFDAVSFQSFLKRILRHLRNGRRIVIILDNARYHHAKILQPWLSRYSEVLSLDFLPPYSPDLNPVERVWKMTRKLCTHNRYFATLEELTNTVSEQFQTWRRPNAELKRLCAII
ncbi:MAG: IS630 family transposase [Candidatus Omnitrophica bacterium]|nr:IS630 family transposase [Candidatus Omnitrophota bacterium]